MSVVNEGPVMGCKWVWDVVEVGRFKGRVAGVTRKTKDREPRGVGIQIQIRLFRLLLTDAGLFSSHDTYRRCGQIGMKPGL